MNSYDKTAAYYSRRRENELRALLRRDYGARKYRIVGQGQLTEVHVYGQMPNSIETGWYLLGGIAEVERNYGF